MRTVLLWFAAAALLAQWCAPNQALARPRFRERVSAVRLRLSATTGFYVYDAISRASNGHTAFSSAPQFGRRGEIEKWIAREQPWPLFGWQLEAESYPVLLFDRAIHYSSGGASLLWRLTGSSARSWDSDEIILGVGPNIQFFPDVRAYPFTDNFDLFKPLVFGVKNSIKWRGRPGHSKHWRFEVGAHWITSLTHFRVSNSELDRAATRSYGASLRFDYTLGNSAVDLGLSFLYQNNSLTYRPIESLYPQLIQWKNIAPEFSIQFWF